MNDEGWLMGLKGRKPASWNEVHQWVEKSMPEWADVEHVVRTYPAHRTVVVHTFARVWDGTAYLVVKHHRDGGSWSEPGAAAAAAMRNLIRLGQLLEGWDHDSAIKWAGWHKDVEK